MVDELIARGIRPGDILVLTAVPFGENALVGCLSRQNARWRAAKAERASSPLEVRTSTLERATGLEALFVIVLGLRGPIEAEADPTNPEREQMTADNTRKLYMAFTRAAHRLVIVWSGPANPPFPVK